MCTSNPVTCYGNTDVAPDFKSPVGSHSAFVGATVMLILYLLLRNELHKNLLHWLTEQKTIGNPTENTRRRDGKKRQEEGGKEKKEGRRAEEGARERQTYLATVKVVTFTPFFCSGCVFCFFLFCCQEFPF